MDLDGDRDLDILSGWFGGRPVRAWINTGQGNFVDESAARFALNAGRPVFELADLDLDGDLDLFCVANGGPASILTNDGSGIFRDVTLGRLPYAFDGSELILISDVDGDGDPDVALTDATPRRSPTLLLNDGEGRFASGATDRLSGVERRVASGARYETMLVADLTGDGRPDVLTAQLLSSVRPNPVDVLWVAGPSGDYQPIEGVFGASAGYVSAYDAKDVDMDGDLDVLRVDGIGNAVIWQNDGAGHFPLSFTLAGGAVGDVVSDVEIGDLNGDSQPDYVFGRGAAFRPQALVARPNIVLLSTPNGSLVLAPGALPQDSDPTLDIEFADLDADGDLDLVCANFGQDRVYLNDGAGLLLESTTSIPRDATRPSSGVVVEDVDADGDLDLFFAGQGVADQLLLNDGAGVFTDASAVWIPARPPQMTESVAVADIDGDGDRDIVCVGARDPREYVIYRNRGGLRFDDQGPSQIRSGLRNLREVAIADMDGDGSPDFVDLSEAGPRLLLNLAQPHLRSITVARLGQPLELKLETPFFRGVTTSATYLFSPLRLAVPLATPFGNFGLDPRTTVALPSGSMASLILTIPTDSSLIGAGLHWQVGAVTLQGLGLQLSDTVSDVISR